MPLGPQQGPVPLSEGPLKCPDAALKAARALQQAVAGRLRPDEDAQQQQGSVEASLSGLRWPRRLSRPPRARWSERRPRHGRPGPSGRAEETGEGGTRQGTLRGPRTPAAAELSGHDAPGREGGPRAAWARAPGRDRLHVFKDCARGQRVVAPTRGRAAGGGCCRRGLLGGLRGKGREGDEVQTKTGLVRFIRSFTGEQSKAPLSSLHHTAS